jgi:hypothetical protein
VRTGRGDLERAAGAVLSPHVGEIEPGHRHARKRGGLGDVEGAIADEMLLNGGEAVGEARLDAAREARFAPVLARHHRAPKAERACAAHVCQDAANGPDGSGERELAEKHDAVERRARHFAERAQGGDGDGEIEGGAGLAQVGGGQIDRDAVLGHEDAEVSKRRGDAHATFAHGAVGQSDHFEPPRTAGARDFDAHEASLETDERRRVCGGQHDPHAGAKGVPRPD